MFFNELKQKINLSKIKTALGDLGSYSQHFIFIVTYEQAQ
jgi:hypothetical protein